MRPSGSLTNAVVVTETPLPPRRQAKPLLGSVSVPDFRAPSFLRAGPIVYRESPEQISFYQYHRWAVDPRKSVTNAIRRKLQALGLFVSVSEYVGRRTSDYLLTGSLEHLEEIDSGQEVTIAAALSAQLIDLKTEEVMWTDTVSEVTPLEHRTLPGVVAGMSQTTALSVEHLVSSLQKRLGDKPRPLTQSTVE